MVHPIESPREVQLKEGCGSVVRLGRISNVSNHPDSQLGRAFLPVPHLALWEQV